MQGDAALALRCCADAALTLRWRCAGDALLLLRKLALMLRTRTRCCGVADDVLALSIERFAGAALRVLCNAGLSGVLLCCAGCYDARRWHGWIAWLLLNAVLIAVPALALLMMISTMMPMPMPPDSDAGQRRRLCAGHDELLRRIGEQMCGGSWSATRLAVLRQLAWRKGRRRESRWCAPEQQ